MKFKQKLKQLWSIAKGVAEFIVAYVFSATVMIAFIYGCVYFGVYLYNTFPLPMNVMGAS